MFVKFISYVVYDFLGHIWCRWASWTKGMLLKNNVELNEMSLYSFIITILLQGDYGEAGPTGRDGFKVRMYLIVVTA